jgi:hypothetical protein
MCSLPNISDFSGFILCRLQPLQVYEIRQFFLLTVFSTCHSPGNCFYYWESRYTTWNFERERMDVDDPTFIMTVALTVLRPAVTRTWSALRAAPHIKHGNLPETNRITVTFNRNQGYDEVKGSNSSGGMSGNDWWGNPSLDIISRILYKTFGSKPCFSSRLPNLQSSIHKAVYPLQLQGEA